jgi:hypothetical protein
MASRIFGMHITQKLWFFAKLKKSKINDLILAPFYHI